MKKKYFVGIAALSVLLCSPIHVNAGSAINSGEGYTVTASATPDYLSCSVTGRLSNGATAELTGYKKTPKGYAYVGTKSSSPYVRWNISEVPNSSTWGYCIGKAYLPNGMKIETSAAFA